MLGLSKICTRLLSPSFYSQHLSMAIANTRFDDGDNYRNTINSENIVTGHQMLLYGYNVKMSEQFLKVTQNIDYFLIAQLFYFL